MVLKLKEYLERLFLLRLHGQHLNHQHFVIGNSSADFDSFFGSIIYGYMKFLLYNTLFIPLIDCKKKQVDMRFEINYVLNNLGIDYKQLFYSSEFPDLQKKSSVMLYDHNIREKIKPIEIIDHHFLKDTTCPRKIVSHCASALTLLYYTLHSQQLDRNRNKAWFEMYAEYGLPYALTHPEYDSQIDEVIRMGILLDSFSLSPKEKDRWIEDDMLAVRRIEQRAGEKSLTSFQTLESIKFDEKMNLQLSLENILNKDYKQFTYGQYGIAYSIILLKPQTFSQNYSQKAIEEYEMAYMKEKKLNCHVHMFLSTKGTQYKRQTIYYSTNKELTEQLAIVLSGLKMEQVNTRTTAQGLDIQHWFDPSTIISRKILEKEISLKLNKK